MIFSLFIVTAATKLQAANDDDDVPPINLNNDVLWLSMHKNYNELKRHLKVIQDTKLCCIINTKVSVKQMSS